MPQRHDHDDGLLTRAEAAALLRVSTRTLDRWAAAGRIPRERTPTGRVRFRRGAVLATIERDRAA